MKETPSVKAWIRARFDKLGWDEENKRIIYLEYSQFKKDTGSLMGLDSFKRAVRKVAFKHFNGPTTDVEDLSSYIQKTEHDNRIVYSYKGPRIMTVDQMLDLLDISLDDWHVDKAIVNKWETPRKNKEVDLKWNDGIMDGTVKDHGNMYVEPLFQVKIWLTKKVLQPCTLAPLKKIEVKQGKPRKKISTKNGLKSAIVLADAQMGFVREFRTGKLIPLHDRRVLSIALHIIQKEQPDEIIFNGDMFDFAELSDKFLNSPEYYFSIQPALIEFAWWVKEIKKVSPNSRLMYLAGNHEDRLNRHITKYSAYAHGLKSVDRLDSFDVLSVPNLAGFEDLGIEWMGNYQYDAYYWLTDTFKVTHGDKASGGSGATVKNIIRDATFSQIVGHIHKFESAEKVIEYGGQRKEIQVWTFGTMCRVDGIVPSRSGFVNWQQGFGKIVYHPEKPELNPDIYPIKVNDGNCIYDHEILIGEDNSHDIAKDTGWDSFAINGDEKNIDKIYFK